MSPTCQKYVVLVVPRVRILFFCSSGAVDLMYSSNGNWTLLPWPSNNPKGVGPSWSRSKTLSCSNYLSAIVRISDLVDPLKDIHIKPGINFPLNLQAGNPGIALPSNIISYVVLPDSYGIDAR